MPTWTQWKPLTLSALSRAPSQPGVYEVALDGRRHRYPEGLSSTVYYGMSDTSIATRIEAHYVGRGSAVLAKHIAEQQRLKVRWRRTTKGRKAPRELECWHIERFVERFGSRPVGNLKGCAIVDN